MVRMEYYTGMRMNEVQLLVTKESHKHDVEQKKLVS